MELQEAASFYGDYSELFKQISPDELYEKVEDTNTSDEFFLENTFINWRNQ